jgi:hypothetical protein
MITIISALLSVLSFRFRRRASLELELVALRHQLAVLRRVSSETRDLIRQMRMVNPLWGAPRIHGELLKLGIEVSQATVGRYLPWRPSVPLSMLKTPKRRASLEIFAPLP